MYDHYDVIIWSEYKRNMRKKGEPEIRSKIINQ